MPEMTEEKSSLSTFNNARHAQQLFAGAAVGNLDATAISAIAALGREDCSASLANLALQPTFFQSWYGTDRRGVLKGWTSAYDDLKDSAQGAFGAAAKARGRIGLHLVTLLLLELSERQAGSVVREVDDATIGRLTRHIGNIFQDRDVHVAFDQMYRPDPFFVVLPDADGGASDQSDDRTLLNCQTWQSIRWDTVTYHRVGTTSFVLVCKLSSRNEERFALKCLLFPYSRVPAISKATDDYVRDFPAGTSRQIVRVTASSPMWVLMDYVDGRSLAEILADPPKQENDRLPLRIDLLSRYGPGVLSALGSLHNRDTVGPRQHLDLAPSNIMFVEENEHDESPPATLIDLGRNHLYDRTIGRRETHESVYIAPEVKNGDSSESSDIFSLGLILAALCIPGTQPGSTLPDRIYEHSPDLARFLEDLIDAAPENRMMLSRRTSIDYGVLATELRNQTLLQEKLAEQTPRRGLAADARRLMWPSSGRVSELRVLSSFVAKHPMLAGANARYLLSWSAMAAGSWYLAFTVTLLWFAREIGLDILPDPVVVAAWFFERTGSADLDHGLSILGYGESGVAETWPARLICFAMGVTTFKFYQTVLAGLSTRGSNVTGKSLAEFAMRWTALCTCVPVLLCALFDPHWWPWAAVFGGVSITLVNYAVHRYADNAVKGARAPENGGRVLSTAPALDDPGLFSFRQWWRSQLVYTIILVVASIGLTTGRFEDEGVYAVGIAGSTLGIQYVVKCFGSGDRVRGVLNRAFLAGERATAHSSAPSPTAGGVERAHAAAAGSEEEQ